MTGLIKKDLSIQTRNVVFGGIYSLIFFMLFGSLYLIERYSQPVSSAFIYRICGSVVPVMLLFGAFKADKNNTNRFIMGLPVSRKTIVQAKYVSFLLYAVYGIVTSAITGLILRLLIPGMVTALLSWRDIAFVITVLSLISFVLPVYFRFGFMIIRIAVIAGLTVMVVLQVILMLVTSILKQFHLIDAAIAVFKQLGQPEFMLGMAAAGMILMFLSYRLSLKILSRKDF